MSEHVSVFDRLREIHKLARNWNGSEASTAVNLPYIDLVFAYGFARLGDDATARMLCRSAIGTLNEVQDRAGKPDEVHSFLTGVFTFRIEEALMGTDPLILLPQTFLDHRNQLGIMSRYNVDRLCQESEILEPGDEPDPFYIWKQLSGSLLQTIHSLDEIHDAAELQRRIDRLLRGEPKEVNNPGARLLVLSHVLTLAHQIETKYILDVLKLVPEAIVATIESQDKLVCERQAVLIRRALRLTLQYGDEEHLSSLAELSIRVIEQKRSHRFSEAVALTGAELVWCLSTLGLRERLQDFVGRLERLLSERSLVTTSTETTEEQFTTLEAHLVLASGWLSVDDINRAEPILDQMHDALSSHPPSARRSTRSYVNFATAYFRSLGYGHRETAIDRIEAAFPRLWSLPNTLTTATHFSQFHFRVSEAAVLAIVQASADAS